MLLVPLAGVVAVPAAAVPFVLVLVVVVPLPVAGSNGGNFSFASRAWVLKDNIIEYPMK